MFKIAILFFAALIRCAEVDVTGKFDIAADGEAPAGNTACTEYATGWGNAVAPTPDEAEPGEGFYATPYYATLTGVGGSSGQHTRCGEMLALFATEDEDLETPFYIVVAASVDDASVDLEIGAQACVKIGGCTGTDFGVAYKLPMLQVLDTSNFKTDVMCQNFIPGDSGDGSSEDSPIYVYVDAIAVLEDHVDCGRVYGFDEYFVAVAGTTAAGSSLDGATLGIKDTDFDALDCGDGLTECGMDGYAIWTGKMASSTTTTTTSEATTTTSDDGSTTTSDDGSTTTSDDGSATTSDDGSTTTSVDGSTTTSVDGSTTTSVDGSTTESTTSTSPPLDTTTEEDSTFFAAVGFSLFALLA